MEDIEGAEFTMEEEAVGQVSVPNYVHPNTHISGYSQTHPNIMQDFFGSPTLMIFQLSYPPITDTLFSLIIFIYVMVTFLYIFYAFCWREEVAEEKRKVFKEEEEAEEA